MKERSIILTAPEIRAILDGRKSQLRRICKVPSEGPNGGKLLRIVPSLLATVGDLFYAQYDLDNPRVLKCPLGSPSSLLWVRETWAAADCVYGDERDTPQNVAYYADKSAVVFGADLVARPVPDYDIAQWNWSHLKRRSSATMPRWASRLTLQVESVRVQRLQDMSTLDAMAEGAHFTDYGLNRYGQQQPGWAMGPTTSHEQCLGTARHAVGNAWDKANPKTPWDANPWIWAITFKVSK